MTRIRIVGKDYSPVSKAGIYASDGGRLENVTGKKFYSELAEACLRDFKVKGKHKLIGYYDNELYFRGNVGVIRNKNFEFGGKHYDVTVQLSCRFDNDKRAFFLAAMLLSRDDFENLFSGERVEISYESVFEILLLYLFKNQLADAAAKGVYRTYHRFENNDSRPHGVIDISRHIRENGDMNNGKIAYNYRELTVNNNINRLILAAYDRLRSKFPMFTEQSLDSRSMFVINTLRTEIRYTNTNVRSIAVKNRNPITHPYYHEYEALRRTCLKILHDDGISVFDAEYSDEVESLLVYVPKLWENYLEKSFRQCLPKEMPLKAQETKPFGFPTLKRTSQPDFVFYRDKKPVAIMDAKFKQFWSSVFENANLSVKVNEDINKCIRDMIIFKTDRTGVIFPCSGKSGLLTDKIHNEPEANTFFDMVGVPVPNSEEGENFAEWHEKLGENVRKAIAMYIEALDLPQEKTV